KDIRQKEIRQRAGVSWRAFEGCVRERVDDGCAEIAKVVSGLAIVKRVLEGRGNKRRVNGGPAIAVYLSIAQTRYRPDTDVRLTEQNAWNLEHKGIGVPILEKVLTGIGKSEAALESFDIKEEWIIETLRQELSAAAWQW